MSSGKIRFINPLFHCSCACSGQMNPLFHYSGFMSRWKKVFLHASLCSKHGMRYRKMKNQSQEKVHYIEFIHYFCIHYIKVGLYMEYILVCLINTFMYRKNNLISFNLVYCNFSFEAKLINICGCPRLLCLVFICSLNYSNEISEKNLTENELC